MKPICIYHGNCADGFGAAWAIKQFFDKNNESIEFHAGIYQNEPPNCMGRDVILADFSYKSDVMAEIAKIAKSILILDHHKSAMEDLAPPKIIGATHSIDIKDFDGQLSWKRHLADAAQDEGEGITHAVIYTLFDMERSGAGISWDFFHPNESRPQLINHIEDRDLWKFKLSKTREIQAAVFSYPYDFDVWTDLMNRSLDALALEGEAIERKHHKDVDELVGVTQRWMKIGGHNVPVANVPYTLTSDAGHIMCHMPSPDFDEHVLVPFAACYWDTPSGRVFSLRSMEGGIDVSEIAAKYGGGGHEHASGFRMPVGWEGDIDFHDAQGSQVLMGSG